MSAKLSSTLGLLLYSLKASYRYQRVLSGVMTEMCFLTHHCFERHEVQIQCTHAHTDMSMS